MRLAALLALCAALPAIAENPRQTFARAVLLELRGQDAEAAQTLEKARLADPSAAPLVQRAAAHRLAANDRAGAATLLRDLAAARPGEIEIQLIYIDFLEEHGRGDSTAATLAQETLAAAIASTTPESPYRTELLRRLIMLRMADGIHATAPLLDQFPTDPAATLTYASLFKSIHPADDPFALEALERRLLTAHRAFPAHAPLARATSEHFRNTDRQDEAIQILATHVQAAPTSLALMTRLGILQLAAGRDVEGVRTLREVLEINPRQALAHQSLAKHYRRSEEAAPARHHAAELLKIRGGGPSEFIELAEEFLSAGDPRSARLLLEKAAFDHPENSDIATKLAIATRRDPATSDRAARLFREAEAIAASGDASPQFLLESAEVLIAEGQIPAAEERLRSAIRSYPPEAKKETAAALRRLATIWETENRNPQAAKSLRQRANTLDPEP